MADQYHEFDILNKWALLSDTEIEKIISDDTIALLQRVVALLSNEAQNNEIVVRRENFVSTVRYMRKLYEDGSRLLVQAILEASDWLDKQQPAKAKETYERFLASCVSKFYRDIARNQIGKISE